MAHSWSSSKEQRRDTWQQAAPASGSRRGQAAVAVAGEVGAPTGTHRRRVSSDGGVGGHTYSTGTQRRMRGMAAASHGAGALATASNEPE